MFLKRITISGFKSFADKVDFDFGSGITCIVGPNGCGKSNILDAFRWVLGEQSARSLRGRQMSDMIFAGSASRRASSVAQVGLLFDNTDRALSVDLNEVNVTRKLYRSGESVYLLNNDTVRLKDIRELLMDTGIAVDAYSIIEQGRVDALLQSNPAERRSIFDEAAGISKYKARRREAERKLERTGQNLLRAADLIGELEKRLRSVKLQAGKARSYKQYEDRLNELRATFVMAEYHRLTGELERLRAAGERHQDEVTAMRTAIGQREARDLELVAQLDRLGEEINAADGRFIQAKSDLLAREERLDDLLKRLEERETRLERLTERQRSDTERLEDLGRELSEARNSLVTTETEAKEHQERIETLSQRDRVLARDLTKLQAILEDEKAGVIDLLRKSARTHNEIVRLNTHRESLLGQKGRLSKRDAQIRAELNGALERKADLAGRIRNLDELIAQETQKLEEKKVEALRTTELRNRLTTELSQAKEQRSALASRRELLEDLQRRREGIGASARRVLDAKERDPSSAIGACVQCLIADLFEVDVQYAPVIEAVVGDATRYLLITDRDTFLKELPTLGELPGRLTTLCQDRLPPIVNERDFSGFGEGFVARALDLVTYPDSFEPVARHLLAKIVVMRRLEDALSASATDVDQHRFVTLQGEVLEPDGRLTLGRPEKSAGLIFRKSELRDIDVRDAGLEARIATLSDQLNRTDAQLGHLDNILQELRSAVYESNTAKVEATAGLAGIEETVQRLAQEQPLIMQEVTLLEHELHDVHHKSEEGGQSLEAIERENRERENLITQRQCDIDEMVERRKEVQEALTQAKVATAQLVEQRKAAADRIAVVQRTMQECEASLLSSRNEREQCQAGMAEAQRSIQEGRQQLQSLRRGITTFEEKCASLRHERETLRRESEDLSQAVKQLRTRLDEAESSLHRVEMSLAETKVRRDELVSRSSEELAIDLCAAYEGYEHREQDWAAVEAEINELRGKMTRLGNVNLNAISELEELEERHGFLAGQRDDLLASQRQLEQLIQKLDHESRERFKATFEEVRDNFRTLFRKLFGGGRADVILEDPENMLECGIEILAQPPGKELQSISLMSGGEKSMTAIALLMSIFKSRPAPCAFMDEVDAALDEANNERFNRIIQEFVRESQFIIVTHSKWTMNIGDRLYGVTMQEPGVSTLVSVELTGANVA